MSYPNLPTRLPDPADAMADTAALADAFAALPPEQRLAVLLVDREGYDYTTTATDPRRPDGHAGVAPERGPRDPSPVLDLVDEPRGGLMDETRDTDFDPINGTRDDELGRQLEAFGEPDHGPEYWSDVRRAVAEAKAEAAGPGGRASAAGCAPPSRRAGRAWRWPRSRSPR